MTVDPGSRSAPVIVKIWDADYPWDVRVEKVTRSLVDSGFELHLVARNTAKRPREERLDGFTVHRLAELPVANTVSGFPAFFNPRWLRRIAEVVRRVRPDAILVRDVPLAAAAVLIGKRFGLPVILDNAENYPAMMQDLWDRPGLRPVDRIVRNPAIVAAVERWVLPRVAHVWAVVEESQQRLERLGVEPGRITVVSNTPPLARLSSFPDAPKTEAGAVPTLGYVGLLEEPRGLETALRGLAIARDRGTPWNMVVVGAGRDGDAFEALAGELGLADSVRFLGWQPNPEALKIMAGCDAGIIPHHCVDTWTMTIPNKLFDYMASGLPVVASNAGPVERILEETGAGVVFRDRDPDDLARALATLTPERRTETGDAGRAAIRRRYHWEWDAERAVESIRHILAATARGDSTLADARECRTAGNPTE